MKELKTNPLPVLYRAWFGINIWYKQHGIKWHMVFYCWEYSVRAAVDSDAELQIEREQKGMLWSSCWCCITAFLQGQQHWSLIDLDLSEVTEKQWARWHWLRPCIYLPVASLQGKKIHMSPAIYGLLHTGSHTWISYYVGVSSALSWFDKAPVFVSCTCGGAGGGLYLCMR